jgi:sugar phosphate isomerase/epimerase
MKLGCNTVLFASADLETALAHVAFAGYEYVELAAIKGMCEHLTPDLGAEEIRAVTGLLAESGLTATAIEAATTDRDRLARIFDVARRLGVPIVNIGSGGTTDDEDSTKQAIEHIAGLADLAAQHDVRLAVKPHVGQAIYNGATALRLMDEVTNPALGLNFDPSHLYRADEQPEDIVRTWGSRIVTSHFRDCGSRERAVGPPESQIPGRGVVDIPSTLRAFSEIGYAGPLNLEVIGAAKYTLAQAASIAAETRGYLSRCLAELAA